MRNGFIGLVTAMVVASTISAAGCSSSSNTAGTGGSGGSTGAGTGGSSGTGGSAGGTSVTSVSSTKAVNKSALSAAEATQLCNDTYAYFGTAITRANGCKWRGLSYASSSSAPSEAVLQQNCTNQESACLSGDGGAFTNPGCNDLPASCTATVAQYSACIKDEATAFTQTVTGLPSCSTLTSAGTSAVFDAQTGGSPPASCASLMTACPALYYPNPFNSN